MISIGTTKYEFPSNRLHFYFRQRKTQPLVSSKLSVGSLPPLFTFSSIRRPHKNICLDYTDSISRSAKHFYHNDITKQVFPGFGTRLTANANPMLRRISNSCAFYGAADYFCFEGLVFGPPRQPELIQGYMVQYCGESNCTQNNL